jgi:hypothetical protein
MVVVEIREPNHIRRTTKCQGPVPETRRRDWAEPELVLAVGHHET